MVVVKIIKDDDGVKIDNPKWCFSMGYEFADSQRTLCSGIAFGYGESLVEYKIKENGKVTCPKCVAKIKMIKNAKI